MAREQLQIKSQQARLSQAEAYGQKLDDQLTDIQGASTIQESKLAIKSEYASKVADEKRALMEQLEPVNAELARSINRLHNVGFLLFLAVSAIALQNIDKILLAKDAILQFFGR